jgi:hypothetical protein
MLPAGAARRLRIYVGEADRWQGRHLAAAIILSAREHGLAGATLLRGLGGFGAHRSIHDARLFEVEGNLPEVVEIIDRADRIAGFLPELARMLPEGQGLVTAEDVEVAPRAPA